MTESVIANEMIELGQMSEARGVLLRIIRLRFPEVLSPDVERAIIDQPNLGLLRDWATQPLLRRPATNSWLSCAAEGGCPPALGVSRRECP